MGDIHGKNFFFGSAKFQAGGPDHFNQFLTEGARFVPCQADGLHGQRTASAYDAFILHILIESSSDSERIDSPMVIEMFVFESNEAFLDLPESCFGEEISIGRRRRCVHPAVPRSGPSLLWSRGHEKGGGEDKRYILSPKKQEYKVLLFW